MAREELASGSLEAGFGLAGPSQSLAMKCQMLLALGLGRSVALSEPIPLDHLCGQTAPAFLENLKFNS